MINSRFNNKNILITGAGTGMGKAAALRLATEGAQLALIGRSEEPLQQVVSEVESLGTHAISLPCDITDTAALSNAIQLILKSFGRLDGVFANAGTLGEFCPVSDTALSQLDSLIDTNLKGTLATIQQSLPLMDTGAIVINASWTASAVMPGAGAYAATKGALLSLMKTLAVEKGQQNIRVNAVSPGIILTPMASEVLAPELSRKLADHTALKRNGTPSDVSGTIAWLLSDDAAFVTGQEIIIDGGYTIGGVRL
ncbi:SDR family NAD(P)-dependent oxidoreductase [Nitrincola iocasae]|uniref:SDR family oxidoreductase n=1 Tax=Nitrincola iocasae TaxID=2614693 RepID=A0A5J6LE94_9GAMM|nr:SDR family oxidoreductase [Nitrincola iocasae]QEW06616.1 SDR family oxidoreductase [Nitrincola iocasae]